MTLITRPTPEDPTTHTASCAGQTRSQHGRTDRRRASPGQALVEFAVLVPVLVMILVVAADFGRALTAYIAISGAAREGAAYGMQSTIQAVDGDGIRAAALADIGSGGEIWGTDVEVSPSIGPIDGQGYYQVVVEVSYTFSPMFPIPELPSTLPMERTVTMRVLQ